MKKFEKVLIIFLMAGVLLSSMMTDATAKVKKTRDTALPSEVSFSGIKINAINTGVELVRTSGSKVTIEYLGVDDKSTYTVKNIIKNGIANVIIKNSKSTVNISFESGYRNVVRVNIPDASYNTFELELDQSPVSMQDFNAPVVVDAIRSAVTVIDTVILRGTYDITGSQGSVNIIAGKITRNITINNFGTVTITFNKKPKNLYLNIDSTTVTVPKGWSTNITKFGNKKPKINISNWGHTTVICKKN